MPEGVNGLGVRKQDVMACYVWIGGDVCVRPVREGMEGECAVSQLLCVALLLCEAALSLLLTFLALWIRCHTQGQ